jgi:hypothetical protein
MSKTDEKHSDRDGQFLQKNVTPTANLSLIVSNLVQRFRTSGKETISWFVAEGELVEIKNVPSTTERVSV